MTDDPTDRRFADAVWSVSRTDEGARNQRAQELRRADELVRLTHEAILGLISTAAGELRQRNISSDTGRFTPTGRGWTLPGLGMWIAWDGSAYTTTSEAAVGKARLVRFDSRRTPRNLFELPSWIPEEGGTRRRVIMHGERLVVTPGGHSFQPVLGESVEARAQLG